MGHTCVQSTCAKTVETTAQRHPASYGHDGPGSGTACPFNILHVCDYVAPYANYEAVYDYTGHVVNCNVKLAES